MEKQKTFTSFATLSSSELNQISGGDWWTNINNFLTPSWSKRASDNSKYKIV